MKSVKIIHTDGKVIERSGAMSLEQAQEIVGGYIEIIRSNVKGHSLVVNEEGFIRALPANPEATKLCGSGVMVAGNYIRGNAILIKGRG